MSFKDKGARIHVSLSLVLLLCGLLLCLCQAENPPNPSLTQEFIRNNIEDGTETGEKTVLDLSTKNNREPKLLLPFFIPLGNKSKFKPTKVPAKITTTPTGRAGNIPIPDQVATLIHNAIRMTHGVPPLTFSPTLKRLAQSCADYHATQGTNYAVDPGPDVTCPTIMGYIAESWDYIVIPPLYSDSQLYRSVLWNWYLKEVDPNYADPAYMFANRHKVQIIWKSTTMYACARSSISWPTPPVAGVDSRIYVSCLYTPAGNDLNTFPQNVFRDSI